MNRPLRVLVVTLIALMPLRAAAQVVPADSSFPHAKHAKLFPSCTTCHAGVVEPGASIWPSAVACASCHDGTVQRRVRWTPPAVLRHTNLRFEHRAHADTLRGRAKDPALCVGCHQDANTPWMQVSFVSLGQCFNCHGVTQAHLAAPDAACRTCHLPFAKAVRLTTADVKAFPKPPSHDAPGFMSRGAEGHGVLARSPDGIAASCATCHAQNFCVTCHVDAPEQSTIRSLEPDARAAVQRAVLREPASHRDAGFLTAHGATAKADAGQCRTCHTQESCLTCHTLTNGAITSLARAAADRGAGAAITRHAPATHTPSFITARHGTVASATPATCASCHARQDCLECHRPAAARRPAYHAEGFLAAHPASAYVRATSCGQCHNQGAFCQSCHLKAGLTATRALGSGYHDAKRSFIAGHGQAARQSLETCVSCHVERDCLTCHSANGGRRFNPHGQGFDAQRMRQKNPDTCAVCHGTNIPGGP